MYQTPRAFGHTAPVTSAHPRERGDAALLALAASLAADLPVTPSAHPDLDPARVRRHDLGPLAHTHGLPGYRGDHAYAAIHHDRALAVATEGAAALAAARIPVALFKGIAYAGTLYRDPAERPMTDVDLLVHPRDADRALTTLHRLGYWHAGPAAQRSPRTHAITLKRRDAAIDLHRSPMQLGRAAIPLDEVLARAAPAAHVPGALQLAPLDELLYHLAHMIRSELYVPLLSYVDAARLLARVDRSAALTLADAWRLGRPARAALAVIDHVLDPAAPPPAWWLPTRAEVAARTLPRRPIQVARKLLLIEGPKELAGFAAAIALGVTYPHRSRRPT